MSGTGSVGHHAPQNRPPIPSGTGLPSRPGRVVLGGAAIVASTFGLFWMYLQRNQARRADPNAPGSVSGWEHRLHDAAYPDSEVSTSTAATRSQRLFLPLPPPKEPNREQHRTIATVRRDGEGAHPLRDDHGGFLHPTPQRDRGDGLAYTKRDAVFGPMPDKKSRGSSM